MRDTTCLLNMGKTSMLTVSMVFRNRRLILLVKLGWLQGKMLGSEEGKVMGSGLLGVLSSGEKLSVGLHSVLGGQHCDENFYLILERTA